MLVKVRLPRGAARRRIAGHQAPFLSGLSGVILLLAFSCLMLAMWRLTSDLGWTDAFVISDGFLSHWQVWMALAIAFGVIAMRLNRYSQMGRTAPATPLRKPARNAAVDEVDAEDLIGPRSR